MKADELNKEATQPEKRPQPSTETPRKYGQGALAAAFRQGFAELTNVLKAFPDSLPLLEQPGQLNNVGPQGVSQQAGFSPSRNAYRNPHIQAVETPTHTQHQQSEIVTSHGVNPPSKIGVVEQQMQELKSTPPSPQAEQELSK